MTTIGRYKNVQPNCTQMTKIQSNNTSLGHMLRVIPKSAWPRDLETESPDMEGVKRKNKFVTEQWKLNTEMKSCTCFSET